MMNLATSRHPRKIESDGLELARQVYGGPQTAKLDPADALRALQLLRNLALAYGVSSSWVDAHRKTFFGRPAISREADDTWFGPTVNAGILAGEKLVEKPGETIRGLIIGIERAAHEARGAK